MCSISIIINQNNKKVDQQVIRAMTNVIEHRGPDGEGFYHGHQFAFRHRRLI